MPTLEAFQQTYWIFAFTINFWSSSTVMQKDLPVWRTQKENMNNMRTMVNASASMEQDTRTLKDYTSATR